MNGKKILAWVVLVPFGLLVGGILLSLLYKLIVMTAADPISVLIALGVIGVGAGVVRALHWALETVAGEP